MVAAYIRADTCIFGAKGLYCRAMQFNASLFSSVLMSSAWLLTGVLLLTALRQAPWRLLLAVPLRQHALFAALALQGLIWSFQVEVVPGFHCHLSLTVTLTLVFGWSFALVGGAIVALLVIVTGRADLQAVPLDWLLSVLLPATLAYWLMRALYRLRLRNLFFYILGLGFFGTIAVTFVVCCAVWLLLGATQAPLFMADLWEKSAVVVPLLYAEGFLNGVLVTAITVFVPDLVKTFDDHHFLDRDGPDPPA